MARLNPARRPRSTTALLDTSRGEGASLVLFDTEEVTQLLERGESISRDATQGYISAHSPFDEDMNWRSECGHVLQVGVSASEKGWGPLLYDALLGWASEEDFDGIIPSRGSIDPSARRIWEHYAKHREDVQSRALPPGCRKYGSDAYLDRIYRAPAGTYLELARRGDEFLRYTRGVYPVDIAKDLHESGVSMFADYIRRRLQELDRRKSGSGA